MKTSKEQSDEAWKKFLKRHWKMATLMIGGIAAAAVVAFFVFLWVVADAQATRLVPEVVGEWTVGYVFTFILTVILWELIFVASWVIPMGIVIYTQWYRKIPEKERKEYERKPRHRKTAGGSSGISCLVSLIWLIIVWIDGRWNLAFQKWTFDDWIYSWIAACLWVLLIVGIPALIYLMWSLKKNV